MMPLTSAERQKLYRERLKENDPEKFASQKRKNANNTKLKRKKIADYTTAEQENIRKQWRDKKKKSKEEPSSSEVDPQVRKKKNQNRRMIYILKEENAALKKKQVHLQRDLDKFKKRVSRCVKKNNKLLDLIKEKNNIICDLKKKISISGDIIERNVKEMSPSSKTDTYIEQNLPDILPEEKERVKKTLLEHHVIVETIKQSYQNKDAKGRHALKDIVKKNELILDKYKMKTKIATFLGLKGKIRHTLNKKSVSIIKTQLKDFYERDDVSKMTAGKNEIKTQKKQKKQRRYLLGTLHKLYKKYCQEGGKLSFATFKRYRPFYVLPPKAEKRDTCACKKHENLQMKATLLNSIGLIATKDLDDLLALIVCDTKSDVCAYGKCEMCKNKSIDFTICGRNMTDEISWDEWNLKTHEYKRKLNKETKITKKMTKEKKSGTLKTLLDAFQKELQIFKTHSYNIFHQYKEYRRCTKGLDDRTIALHIDFSENYSCKLSTEIQAMHFGASRQQITLHTGIVYTAKGNKCFASISPNNEHGPDAIWAHLLPVLKLIRETLPSVDGIHFYSDGPTVQYRQKKNFYYFAKFTRELGFPFSTWNFFEASHGKGAADGVGGAIKRRLDSFVAYGADITDASTAFKLLQESETKIKLFYIPYDSILKESPDLVPVPNTMKIHQIINNLVWENSILYRNLSCFCQKTRPGFCDCFDVKTTNLMKQIAVKNVAPGKVRVLGDVRITDENRPFYDLSKCAILNQKKVENISPSGKDVKIKQNTQKKRKLLENQKPKKKPKL